MSFSSVPVREPGPTDVSWWNTLRTAGLALQNLLGGGTIAQTTFTVANNTGPSNVTGLTVSSATCLAATVKYQMRRVTDSSERITKGVLHLFYRNLTSAWDIVQESEGDESGVTFSVTAGGQVQYTSDDHTGANYSGSMKFKIDDTISA